MKVSKTKRVRTAAKAKSFEILRLAETESPQRNKPFVLVAAELWKVKKPSWKPMGQWLLENMSRAGELEIPCNRESKRKIPFTKDGIE